MTHYSGTRTSWWRCRSSNSISSSSRASATVGFLFIWWLFIVQSCATTTTTTKVAATASFTIIQNKEQRQLQQRLVEDEGNEQNAAAAASNSNSNNANSNANGIPNLPFGDVNIIIVTDVHSWIAGHGYQEHDVLNVNYGNVLSFYERIAQYCLSTNRLLLFVMNGDWLDGTGLGFHNKLRPNIEALTSVIQKMPFDLINVGNHELYNSDIITEMIKPGGLVEWFDNSYLASNIYLTNTPTTADMSSDRESPSSLTGYRYKIITASTTITTNTTGPKVVPVKLLCFGFLYNLLFHSDLVQVEKVEQVMEASWFHDILLQDQYSAILVMAHMHASDALTGVIHDKIRSVLGYEIPIQFITGHSHLRQYEVFDEYATSFEAGRFLDTIGFVSFPIYDTVMYTKNEGGRHLQQEEAPAPETTTTIINSTTPSGPNNNNSQPQVTPSQPSNTTTSGSTEATTTTAATTTPPPTNAPTPPPTSAPTPSPTTPPPTNAPTEPPPTAPLFKHLFINANIQTLVDIVKLPSSASASDLYKIFDTPRGKGLSHFINRVQDDLGLTTVIGCNPLEETYRLNSTLYETYSLWRLFQQEVFPRSIISLPPITPMTTSTIAGATTTNATTAASTTTTTAEPSRNLVLLSQKGALRYDLKQGPKLRLDDVIAVSPYNTTIYVVAFHLPGSIVTQLNDTLNSDDDNDKATVKHHYHGNIDENVTDSAAKNNLWWKNELPFLPNYILSIQDNEQRNKIKSIRQDGMYHLLANEYDMPLILQTLQKIIANTTNSIVIDPQPTVNGVTPTSLWISHVQENWECREEDEHATTTTSSNPGHPSNHHNGNHHNNGHHDTNNNNGGSSGSSSGGSSGSGSGNYHSSESSSDDYYDQDAVRLFIMAFGLVCVFVLGGIYIWQRDTAYVKQVAARNRALYDTMNEAMDFHGGSHDSHDDDNDNSDNHDNSNNPTQNNNNDDQDRQRFRNSNRQNMFEPNPDDLELL